MEDKLSVIIPVYNVSNYLRRCIDSLLNQTYKNIEIILVDDGSTDGSGDICEEYKLKYSKICVIHLTNGGVSRARNIGIDNASGDWITFVDSDDFIVPDMYEVLVNNAHNYQVPISVCGYKCIDDKDILRFNESEVYAENAFKLNMVDSFSNLLDFEGKYGWPLWNKIYKANLIQGHYFNEKLKNYEDLLYLYELYTSVQGLSTVYTDSEKYCYIIRKDSASHQAVFRESNLSSLDICNLIMQDSKKRNMDEIIIRKTRKIFQKAIIGIMLKLLNTDNGQSRKYYNDIKIKYKDLFDIRITNNFKDKIKILLFSFSYDFARILYNNIYITHKFFKNLIKTGKMARCK